MFNLLENACSFFDHFLSHPGGMVIMGSSFLGLFGGVPKIVKFVQRVIFPIIKKNKISDELMTETCKKYLEEKKNEKNEETPKNGV